MCHTDSPTTFGGARGENECAVNNVQLLTKLSLTPIFLAEIHFLTRFSLTLLAAKLSQENPFSTRFSMTPPGDQILPTVTVVCPQERFSAPQKKTFGPQQKKTFKYFGPAYPLETTLSPRIRLRPTLTLVQCPKLATFQQ